MGGSKKGGGHTPYEQPESGRSKQRVKIVEVISEGEVQGLANGVKSVYLDKTPIQNSDGSYNFSNIEAQGVIGSQDQNVMSGFNTSENEVAVSVEVKKTTPITRTINDEKINRLRLTLGVKGLFQQKDNGDTVETSVDLLITVGTKTYPVNIKGKYSSQYLRQIVIDDLPKTPFLVKVERITDDSKSQRLQNATVWASYTEIIDTAFAYPNTALAGIMFDSEYFNQIPQRNYEILGIKVLVPRNYDPSNRTYSGLWDGTFKLAWTNNPAWIFYDLMTNKRYGMGQRLGEFGCDKWSLYAIAQYCDQIVPDGFGSTEPRMTCNCWLTEQRQAYDLINDLASIFRAMPVWNGAQLTAIQDRPSDPVWTYTNANVAEGEFTRSYSALKARHNTIHVEYLDAADFYEKKIEYVSDSDLVKRYGLNVRKVTAFGCTSRGQAYRAGRWILETEKLEKETITFTVGREGLMHLPGDIIRVSDNHYAGTNIGGRVVAINDRVVTLDREIEINGSSYFSFINDKAKHTTIKIQHADGKKVTLESAPVGLVEYGVWSLSTASVTSGLYRAIGISESDGKYTITALQHEPQKEAIVDNGAHFEPRDTTLHSAKPAQVTHSDVAVTEDGIALTWEQPTVIGTVTYDVKLYKNDKLYRTYTDLKEPRLTFEGLPDGSYVAEIRAKNQLGQYSNPVTKSFEINLKITELRTTSELMAIRLDWQLPTLAAVGSATEIWRSKTDDLQSAVKIATLSYPQVNHTVTNVGLSERWYFWARMTDKSGNKGEFTEAVFGEADHNPDNLVAYLEGQITNTELGKDLIAQLTGFADGIEQASDKIAQEARDRAAQLLAEAQARTVAVKKAADKAAADLLAEAQTRGTQVTALQEVDEQQAQLINQATAKADNALAGLETEKVTRAEADKAEAKARETLASKVNGVEANVTDLKRTVATHTQSIAETTQNLNAKIDGSGNLVNPATTQKGFYLDESDGSTKIRGTHYLTDFISIKAGSGYSLNVINGAVNNLRIGYYRSDHSFISGKLFRGDSTYQYITAPEYAEFIRISGNYQSGSGFTLIQDGAMSEFVHFKQTQAEIDKAQALEITTAKAQLAQSAAEITALRSTVTTANKAQADETKAIKATVGSHATKISAVESAVADNQKAAATRLATLEASVGHGGNLLQNSEFLYPGARNIPEGYGITNHKQILGYHNLKNTQWTYALKDEAVFGIRDNRTDTANPTGATNSYVNSIAKFPVRPGQILQFSCYVAGWGLRANSGDLLFLDFRASDGATAVSKTRTKKGNYRYPNITTIATGKLGRKAAADTYTSPTQFERYYFNEVIPDGVDFVNIGIAIRSNFGTDCYLFCCLPQLCEVASLDAPLVPYTPGSNAAKMQNATAKITEASSAVATLEGKVKATHTVQVQSIAGGRKAFAGIALGTTADNKTAESSVIVMAGKFGVVKNANDGTVVPMFSVVNNKTAVNGDLIASGSILGTHIRAGQTLSSPVINGGSLNIGNGRFAVNSSGQVSIRNTTANVGLTINNEAIIVYDERGQIRVKLGKL